MNTLGFPSTPLIESQISVSQSARIVADNGFDCLNFYIGNSIYVKDLIMKDIEASFNRNKDIWLAETKYVSSISMIVNNDAHQEIISLGPNALPFILEDLRINDHFWFNALTELTGENPIKPEHKGRFSLMKADWLQWADENY